MTREFLFPHLGGTDLACFRVGGPGLGNMLMPWARCMIAAQTEDLPVIAPTWPQVKVGPLLRGESDLRSYAGIFSKTVEQIRGAKKAFLLTSATRMSERGDVLRQGLPSLRVRVFSGLGSMFHDLRGHGAFLNKRLTATAHPSQVPQTTDVTPVGLHVRCGDFRNLADTLNISPDGVSSGERLPIDYYLQALQALREAHGQNLPVTLYSDGKDEELAPLLVLSEVRRAASKSALSDLFSMSHHPVLIGSPHSTFSMWAAFMGQSEYIAFPEAGRSYGLASTVLRGPTNSWKDQLTNSAALACLSQH